MRQRKEARAAAKATSTTRSTSAGVSTARAVASATAAPAAGNLRVKKRVKKRVKSLQRGLGSPFEQGLQKVLCSVRKPPAFYTACSQAARELSELLAENGVWRGRLLPFGSVVQGTCCEGSDCDLALVLGKSPEFIDPVDILELAVKAVRASESSFQVLQQIFTARVPVLRLLWRPIVKQKRGVPAGDPLELDLCVGTTSSAQSDLLLATLLSAEAWGRDTSVLLKTWAKRRKVHGAFEGLLSSYCWTLLVVYSLRRARSAGVSPDSLQASVRTVLEDVCELGRGGGNQAVDAARGSVVRGDQGASRRWGRARPPLTILDPVLGPGSNAARCLTRDGWQLCLSEARRAVELFPSSGAQQGGLPKPGSFAEELFRAPGEEQGGAGATGRSPVSSEDEDSSDDEASGGADLEAEWARHVGLGRGKKRRKVRTHVLGTKQRRTKSKAEK
ncbi:unnamed protein product [Polarella glacialis]|uniref:Poly(A) RNA polymerase mitochondrial-like central palm domain-containing protein n=1 Tax=Polarella glacialis TaxID=89957 RepID=A0A813G6K4_POLGL|nr:unnamed protein product [Polarella glacialis]